MSSPTPEQIRAGREAAGLSQAQAARVALLGDKARWSEYERGIGSIDAARWALFLMLTDQHPEFRVERRS
jgi:transcriptional regulator with XRE-family HTH domain